MTLRFTDLDAHPGLQEQVLGLFRGCPPGRDHAVIGEPSRMGLDPRREDLDDTLGVLVAIDEHERVLGALGICPYSDEQVTLWGPVVHRGHVRQGIGSRLLSESRTALKSGGFDSLRVLVDDRNRNARSFFLAKGLSDWKPDHIYERTLGGELPPDPGGVSLARPDDLPAVAELLSAAFPESGHLEQPLQRREREGYRHHILQETGRIVAVGVIKNTHGRSWLSLVAVHPELRGRHFGSRLLAGILHQETELHSRCIGLEVLGDNEAAIGLYTSMGFTRSWTASIMTGPI